MMLFTWNAKATMEDYERVQALGNSTNQAIVWNQLQE